MVATALLRMADCYQLLDDSSGGEPMGTDRARISRANTDIGSS